MKCFCKTPEKYSITKNGGIAFGDFKILDDDMKRRLVERVKQFEDPQSEILLEVDRLQTFNEAKSILDSRPSFLRVRILLRTIHSRTSILVKYLQIFEEVLLDIKVIVIAPSIVPLFAWEAYSNSGDSPELQNLVVTVATGYSNLAPEEREELEGKIFVAYSAQSFEIMDDYSFTQIKQKPAACFLFGDLVGSTNFRMTNQ